MWDGLEAMVPQRGRQGAGIKYIVSGLVNRGSPEDIDRSQTRDIGAHLHAWASGKPGISPPRHSPTQGYSHPPLMPQRPAAFQGHLWDLWHLWAFQGPGLVRDLKGEQGEVQGMARAVGNKGTHALRRPDIRSRLRDSLHASACRGCWAAYLRMHIPT